MSAITSCVNTPLEISMRQQWRSIIQRTCAYVELCKTYHCFWMGQVYPPTITIIYSLEVPCVSEMQVSKFGRYSERHGSQSNCSAAIYASALLAANSITQPLSNPVVLGLKIGMGNQRECKSLTKLSNFSI